MEMLNDSSLPRVYLMVDAFDEYKFGLSQLLKLIVSHTSKPLSWIKWLVLSCNWSDIKMMLKVDKLYLNISLKLNSSHISQAMNTFIDIKVSEIGEQNRYDSKLYKEVSSYLCRNVSGTFL